MRTEAQRESSRLATQRDAHQIDPETGLERYLARRFATPRSYLRYLLAKRLHHERSRTGSSSVLTVGDLLAVLQRQEGLCALSGLPMTHSYFAKGVAFNTNMSIDRIDSTRGYEIENIQLVCATVNIMKGSMSQSDFLGMCSRIVERYGT